jgi:OmpA-OmpF porin, OOP family
VNFRSRSLFLSVGIVTLAIFLSGCALEWGPKRGWLAYHKPLPSSERAIEAARAAGKDRECPTEFKAAEALVHKAYETYWACHTNEAIAMATEAIKKTNELCPPKPVVAPPPPPPAPAPVPPPPPPAPTVTISSSPASIVQGQCTNLTWSSSNATGATIDQGVGTVDPSGTKQVCPTATTQFTVTGTGPGGSQTASTIVTVTSPPPPPPPPPPVPAPAPRVIDRLTLHVNFDFDKSAIRKADEAELQKAIDFLKKYPGYKVMLEGHTDSIGREAYNQRLSERRAAAVKNYLVTRGAADSQKIETKGFGESKPIADNKTKEGRFQNRRVEVLILSE